jgi:hypothetical protein
MNMMQQFKKRMEIANNIRPMNRHKNCLKWNSNETDEHIQMKLEICKWLKQQGYEFYTEAIFMSGDRADIVDADRGYIIEVVCTENEESLLKKASKYPLPIITVRARQEFNEKLVT